MAKTLKDFVAEHSVDRGRVEGHKARMFAEVRAYRLRGLRERAGLTQAQVAERIGVGQRQVSKTEQGNLDRAKVGTIRNYIEAGGGELTLECVIGDQRIQVPEVKEYSSTVRRDQPEIVRPRRLRHVPRVGHQHPPRVGLYASGNLRIRPEQDRSGTWP